MTKKLIISSQFRWRWKSKFLQNATNYQSTWRHTPDESNPIQKRRHDAPNDGTERNWHVWRASPVFLPQARTNTSSLRTERKRRSSEARDMRSALQTDPQHWGRHRRTNNCSENSKHQLTNSFSVPASSPICSRHVYHQAIINYHPEQNHVD